MNNVRPNKIDNYIGNEKLIEKIKISAVACQKLRKPFPHTLLNGSSGSGKTTIAKIIASLVDKEPKIINGTGVATPADIIEICVKAKENDVIFIDEIHSLNIKVQEHMYSVLEDACITVKKAKFHKDILSIPVKKFTIIGATTNLGALSPPFINRFGIIHSIEPYTNEQIAKILQNICSSNNIDFDNKAISLIANASRCIPRIAINLLTRSYDRTIAANHKNISVDIVQQALANEEIDKSGLSRLDRKYISFLSKQSEPVGIKTISAGINEDEETIAQFIEPFLLQKDIVARTSRGRVLNGNS